MFSFILLLGLVSISQCQKESSFTKYKEADNSRFEVALYDTVSKEFKCGGALFNPYYALTAAKCVFSYRHTLDQLKAFLVMTLLYDKSYSYDIEDVIIHKDFVPYIGNIQINDIALIKLLSPVAKGINIQYGILPGEDEKIKIGRPVKVLAFDKTANVNRIYKYVIPVLQNELNIVSQRFCRRQYQRFGHLLTEDHVCARYNASLGSCVGSLGFPLVDTRRRIIGILTFPFVCRPLLNTGLPSLYARVSSYVSWIYQTLPSKSLKSDDLEIVESKNDGYSDYRIINKIFTKFLKFLYSHM